jgi:hypothetical protein
MDDSGSDANKPADRAPDPVRGSFLLGVMLGGAIGAALGLLYAPRPGKDVRRDLADRSTDLVERTRVHVDDEAAPEAATPPPTGDAPL